MRRPTSIRRRVRWAGRRGTSALRPLPEFLIVGAPKCGTSSLYRYLLAHPQVLPATRKEVQFFTEHFERGTGWYRAHFPTVFERWMAARRSAGPAVTGEADVGYLRREAAPARAAAVVPDARIIVLLRDPVDRTISHFHQKIAKGREPGTIEDVLEAQIARSGDDGSDAWRRGANVLAESHYALGLRRWFEHFRRDQVLVLETEELTRGSAPAYPRVLEFLGLQSFELPEFVEYNTRDYPAAESDLRAQLRDHFVPYNEDLEQLLGRSFDWS